MSAGIRELEGVRPRLGRDVYVDPAAVVIGDVEIGADSSVWPMAVVRGDVQRIRIGERTSVQDGAVLHVTHDGPFQPGGFPLQVGSDVTIGHRAVLHGCTIGDRCLIGIGAIILDGASLAQDVIVAAGAVVTPGMACEPRSMYVGAPARFKRSLTDVEVERLAYGAQWYVQVKNRYLSRA